MKRQQLGDVMKKRWRVQVGDIVRHKEFGTVFIVTNTDLYISILGTTGIYRGKREHKGLYIRIGK